MLRAIGFHAAAKLLRPATGLALAAAQAGCMTVQISGADQETRVIRGFGVLRVELADPKGAITGSVSGIGLVGAPLGWSAGYTRQRWAILGKGCRTVVWPPPGGLDDRLRAELARAAAVCVMPDDDASKVSSTGPHEGDMP
jgi:hypothetical protein